RYPGADPRARLIAAAEDLGIVARGRGEGVVANADAGLAALERPVEAAVVGREGDAAIEGSGQDVAQVLARLHLAQAQLCLVLAAAAHPAGQTWPVGGGGLQAHVRRVVGTERERVEQSLIGGAASPAGVQDREVGLHAPLPEEVAPPSGNGPPLDVITAE